MESFNPFKASLNGNSAWNVGRNSHNTMKHFWETMESISAPNAVSWPWPLQVWNYATRYCYISKCFGRKIRFLNELHTCEISKTNKRQILTKITKSQLQFFLIIQWYSENSDDIDEVYNENSLSAHNIRCQLVIEHYVFRWYHWPK